MDRTNPRERGSANPREKDRANPREMGSCGEGEPENIKLN
tara:strand:+ start:167 stop:286 length:120 start_codon:yes stop_codon:yes gene_type:complete